jgi:hypothetical protein
MKKFLCYKILLFLLCFFAKDLVASHNGNRFFNFLERPEYFLNTSKNKFDVSMFYKFSSNAFRRWGGKAGPHELFGRYNLSDIFESYKNANESREDIITQLSQLTGVDKDDMIFNVSSPFKTVGFSFQYDRAIVPNFLFVGAFVPFMSYYAKIEYFASDKITKDKKDKQLIETLFSLQRRKLHDNIGFIKNYSKRAGLGDFELYTRLSRSWQYQLLMKSISLYLQTGVNLPSGVKRDVNNPASLPFMGDGHISWNTTLLGDFELKDDLQVGLMLGLQCPFEKKKLERIPVGNEPYIFSSLTGNVKVNPGYTFKISPYLALENIKEGLDFKVRYTYLRHGKDHVKDVRDDKTIPSYLTKISNKEEEIKKIKDIIREKEILSQWRLHVVSLELLYDLKRTFSSWDLNANVYAGYDISVTGRGASDTHSINLGSKISF